jgi:glycosyltransferase involved in cell wall biosynthesis
MVADLSKECTRVHTLLRLDNRPIGDDRDEIRAFMTVRDEMLRLPQNLNHHRSIGVTRFFVVDNGSTDGSREFLLAQPDCHLFLTHNSYAESRYGLEWQHAVLDEYGTNHWCLIIDADEWFIYPGYERKPLPDLAAYLDRRNAQGIFSFLLDMYGPGTIADATAAPHRSLLDACRYFDSQYVWRRRLRIPGLHGPHFPEYNVTGGPRWRLFIPFLHGQYYLLRIIWHISETMRFPLPMKLRRAPTLRKIPFLRWLPGTRYLNPHTTTPIKLSDITGVLLHFKFLEDFFARVHAESNRKEHWDGASEYARYLATLKDNPSLSFHYAGSVEYEGSEQLIRLSLLREDQQWTRIRSAGGAEIIEDGVMASPAGSLCR